MQAMHKLYEYADDHNLKKKGVIECDDALRALCGKDEFRSNEVMISPQTHAILSFTERSHGPAPRRMRNDPRAREGTRSKGEEDQNGDHGEAVAGAGGDCRNGAMSALEDLASALGLHQGKQAAGPAGRSPRPLRREAEGGDGRGLALDV